MLGEAQRPVRDLQMSVSKRFGRFKDEDEKAVREVKIKEDKTRARLFSAWQRFHKITRYAEPETLFKDMHIVYALAREMVRYRSHKPGHVADFCIQIVPEEYDQRDRFSTRIGLFISALIDKSRYGRFEVPAQRLSYPDYLAYANRKNVLVHGDIGIVGLDMHSGRVVVEGDVVDFIGKYMDGGVLIVAGNVTFHFLSENSIGGYMTGGIIQIDGDVKLSKHNIEEHDQASRLYIGRGMSGGEIHIRGQLPENTDLSQVKHGKIYHKGKLILDK